MTALAAPAPSIASSLDLTDGRLVALLLGVALRADALSRDPRLEHLSDRKLWLQAELEVCERWERECGLLA